MFRKLPWVVLALLFLSTARCYTADLAAGVGAVPFVGPILVPPPGEPAYVQAIGTPAPVELPESEVEGWFPAEESPDGIERGDWEGMALAAAAARTPEGWKELCGRASAATGQDRAAKPLPGALACSDDPTVTAAQRLAVQLLDLWGTLGLLFVGAPGSSVSAVQARQAELRVVCAGVPPGAFPAGVVEDVCARALDAGYLAGDARGTLASVKEAYAALAAAIAARDPTTETEPGTFDAPAAAP